ncbi:hypothetical protein SAMN05428954_1988 [Streptomyces sp. 2112.3]|nr:hypothetical protein BX261_5349 [Streptomyces sp. 2321.6]SDR17181.1 hypothetical protein SAMN05216511_1912 [Streptomyces sp. KS_16]SED64764.1 hypothetical protein SAMN05428940_5375 [Streptomyces sp. 2133.1]SEE18563.1 hypothetical protein SAMN05428954_1988 [Streptomyces sp. 2112.3]SNC71467.1 hypothetical protein SAMN06272741_5276 [Streptomyces sp. 2114.4]
MPKVGDVADQLIFYGGNAETERDSLGPLTSTTDINGCEWQETAANGSRKARDSKEAPASCVRSLRRDHVANAAAWDNADLGGFLGALAVRIDDAAGHP